MAESPQPRPISRLAEEVDLVASWLRFHMSLDDCAATASPGYSFGVKPSRYARPGDYQPVPRNQFVKVVCTDLDCQCASPWEASWERDVERGLDRFPAYLQRAVPTLLRKLDWLDQQCVELVCCWGLSYNETAKRIRLAACRIPLAKRLQTTTDKTVTVHCRAGLERIARWTWTETGAPFGRWL